MKKLLFGLIATVMLGLNVNATEVITKNTTNQNEADLARAKVIISIDWGRKSRDCSGFGICSITITVELEPTEISFRGTSNDKGNLSLELSDTGLKNLRSTFGSNTIILEEDYTLTDEACKALELRPGYTIKAGKYTVKSVGKGLYAVVL
jgi:hypothetical protein